MLRPKPSRIELGPEDIEDFKAEAQRRQNEYVEGEHGEGDGAVLLSGPTKSPTTAERIGYIKPIDPQRTHINRADRV